jgi:hypothetical protein
VGPAIKFIDSPTIDDSLKKDILGFLYNMVTEVETSRAVAVEADAVQVLWKIVKDSKDDVILTITGRIVKELCATAVEPSVHKKMMSTGIMKILLKLSKFEIPQLKLDISCCIYDLTKGDDTLKVLKWDGIDVMFWLVLHDCLNLYDAIRLNVALALRNMSANSTGEIILLSKEDRLVQVLKALSKSNREEVLEHNAGAIFNIMTVEEGKAALLKKGIVKLIFDLAASGYTDIRHICSSCLHMAPNDIPDMSDPGKY